MDLIGMIPWDKLFGILGGTKTQLGAVFLLAATVVILTHMRQQKRKTGVYYLPTTLMDGMVPLITLILAGAGVFFIWSN